MAARIYADVKGNKCSCGDSFTKRVPHPDDSEIIVPRCAGCDQYPSLFVIDADIKDVNGNPGKTRIRHDQNNSRLDKISKVVFTLERIQQEIKEGVLDVRKYDSEISREAFKFSSYAAAYLARQEAKVARGDLSPKELKNKQGLFKRELLPYFKETDITKINEAEIGLFIESYTYKLRTRDLARGELRAMLKQAYKDGMIKRMPMFDKIPKAAQVEDTCPLPLAKETIALIPNELVRIMYLLRTIFPVRPSDICAVHMDQVNRFTRRFDVSRHFSAGVLLGGRKSIKQGKGKDLYYDYTDEAATLFDRAFEIRMSIDSDSPYLFLNSKGEPFDVGYMSDFWRDARRKLGHKYPAYHCKHARLSELSDKMNGNLIKLKRASGHTNTATLERYVRNRDDMRELF